MLASRRMMLTRRHGIPLRSPILDWNSTGWKYLAAAQTDPCASDGVEDIDLSWTAVGFDDSAWTTAQAPIGWGFGGTSFTPRNTTISQEYELWMRHTLPGGISGPYVEVKVDNYLFAYFNGNKVPGSLPSGAWTGADNGNALKILGSVPTGWVRDDVNVLALHVQDQLSGYGSGDILIGDGFVSAFTGFADFFDDFDRADSSSSIGGSWTAIGTWGISSDEAYVPDTSAALHFATADAGVGDGTISVDVPAFKGASLNGGWGVTFRFTDGNNNYVADFGTTSPGLYKGAAGTYTLLASFGSTMNAGDTIQVVMAGSSLICKRIRGGSTTTLASVTDSTWTNTKTKHGLYAFGDDTISRFDNFSVS